MLHYPNDEFNDMAGTTGVECRWFFYFFGASGDCRNNAVFKNGDIEISNILNIFDVEIASIYYTYRRLPNIVLKEQ